MAGSGDPCIVHRFFPQLVGQRRGRSQIQSGCHLWDGRGKRRLGKGVAWRRFILSSRGSRRWWRWWGWCWLRFCRTKRILRGLWWSGLNTQSCVRCEAEREQGAGELCLPEASPGETLKEGERRQGRVTPTDVLHHASQRSLGREALAQGLTGGQPDLRARRGKQRVSLERLHRLSDLFQITPLNCPLPSPSSHHEDAVILHIGLNFPTEPLALRAGRRRLGRAALHPLLLAPPVLSDSLQHQLPLLEF